MEIAARFEHKFLIDDARRAELLARFADRLRPDTAGSADGRYPVVSLYCDTPDRRCHWEAWRGVPSRRKLRVRIYGTRDGIIPAATFVEVKHRDGRAGAKRRVRLPLADAHALVGGADVTSPDPADERILAEIRRMVAEDGYAPAPELSLTGLASPTRFHAADVNRDARITLLELTRVIELYNYRSGSIRTGQYRLKAGSEDGFEPGPSP